MSDLDEVYSALKKADAAGDTAGAKRLADYIRSQPGTTQTQEIPEQRSGLQKVGDYAAGAVDAALTVGGGLASQVIGIPKDVAEVARKATQPLSRETPEQKKKEDELAKQPGVTEKLQGMVEHQPKTPEGKEILEGVGKVMEPISKVTGAVRKASEAVVGKEATQLGSDALAFGGGKLLGTESKVGAALKGAESTQGKVQRIISNLSTGKSVQRADVGAAAGKQITKTLEGERKVGSAAYDELSQIMGPNTDVPVSAGAKAAARYGTGIAVDGTVKAFSDKIRSVGSMTFDSMKDLRTQISDAMGTDRNVNRKLRALRDGLTADIEARAQKLGPDAKAKWDKANATWKAYKDREDGINKALGKNWQGKTATEVYNKLITSARNDPKKITDLMDNIKDPAARKQFAASVLHHMSDRGGTFDGDKLIAQWDRMDPQARGALFRSIGGNYEANMNKLVENLKRIKAGKTGLGREAGGLGVVAILSHFVPGFGTVAAPFVAVHAARKFGPRMVEEYLTSPRWVRYLAEKTAALPEKATGAGLTIGQPPPQQTQPTVGDVRFYFQM